MDQSVSKDQRVKSSVDGEADESFDYNAAEKALKLENHKTRTYTKLEAVLEEHELKLGIDTLCEILDMKENCSFDESFFENVLKGDNINL